MVLLSFNPIVLLIILHTFLLFMHRVFRLLFRPVDGCDIAQSVPLYPRMAEPLPALGAGIFLMLPGCQAARMVMVAARGCDAPPIGQVLEADCTWSINNVSCFTIFSCVGSLPVVIAFF